MIISRPIIAFVAGALSVLAFAPFHQWWLLVFTLAGLFLITVKATPRSSFQLGWIFGLGYFGFGISWIFNSLYDFGNAPFVVAVGLTALTIGCLALFPALSTWLYSLLRAKYQLLNRSWPIVFSCSWIFFEWVRSWFLTGFTWLSIGQSLPDSLLSGWVPVVGSLGAGLILLFIATLAATFIRNRSSISTIMLLVAIALGTWLVSSITWVSPRKGQPLVATLVQGNIDHDLKWDRARLEEVIARYIRLSLEHPDSDIILWPETAIPTYYQQIESQLLPQLQALMHGIDAALITGIFAQDAVNGQIHNSLVVIGDDEQFYHKRHLVPFGEYLPFRWILDFMQGLIKIPMSDLTPGTGTPWMSVKGVTIGPTICYEAIFSDEVAASLPQAQLLVNVTNDAWFGDSLAPHQHLQIAQVRSLETGRWMMRAANNGISAFIDHRGHIVSQTRQFETATLEEKVIPMQGKTPFVIWKNYLTVTLVILCLIIMPVVGRYKSTGNSK